MNAATSISETTSSSPQESQRQLLEMARQLDRFGHQAEEFLRLKFEQLERAVDEFDRERAAWRRQVRRESNQLARQREDLQRSRDNGAVSDCSTNRRRSGREAGIAARASGTASVRVLICPDRANSRQVGQLLFELSKMNRDMGGQGLRFEVLGARRPRWSLFRHRSADRNPIVELTAFSALPLSARGTHVSLDVDMTDRVENWIAFKSRLLRSNLTHNELAATFRKAKPVDRSDSCAIVRAAVGYVDRTDLSATEYSGVSLLAHTSGDVIQQQLDRLDGCCETLQGETGIRVHIELADR